jgi:tetratricopeptide (TPR) repeat protein
MLLSQPSSNTEGTLGTPPAGSGRAMVALMGIVGFLWRLRAWTAGHWLRGVTVATALLSLIGLTIGGWAYLASVALRTGQITLETALAALDQGHPEDARNLASRMLTGGTLPRNEYGGPLYVLGVVKMNDADTQEMPDRRRIEYSIAARYLNEARAYGVPSDREEKCAFLLGKSLIESGQFDEGVLVLGELATRQLDRDDPAALEAQYLLAETNLLKPRPNLAEALRYNDALLGNKNLTSEQRTAVVMQRAQCLSRLERYKDARAVAGTLAGGGGTAAAAALLMGTIALDEADAALQRLPVSDRAGAAAAMVDTLKSALDELQKADSLDESKGPISQQACYQIARGLALKGDDDAALKQFVRTRQLYGDSPEVLAAILGEADALRQLGNFDDALLAYQRMLDAYSSLPVYRSQILPVERIRDHSMAAVNAFVSNGRFNEALALVERLTPLFSRTEQLELRGRTLEQWGNQLDGAPSDAHGPEAERAAGLERLRAAGVAFEQLAELRFATKSYTSDLWRAAENFFLGQSFSRAITALHKYLRYEPELRNAQAMLRLGQAHLALGQIPQSIISFEECIEFHPLDTSTFQARVDCAKAHWYQGNTDRAEALLRENIGGSSLKPLSPEWRDSLFELGMLLHEKEKFEDAIGKLEEAIERYPHDPQRLVAQYVIGESYRRWAQQMLEEVQRTRSPGERDKVQQLATERLTTALNHFEEVQRTITLKTHDIHSDPLMGTMLRNCYMLEGAVLFDLGTMSGNGQRYKDAIEAYSNVSSLYPDEPFVLETFVQISNCWRRLERHDNARGAVHQAQIVLERLSPNSDFASTTVHSREEWRTLLANMSKW